MQHFQTIHGCDSTVTLHLTVHYSDSTEFSQTVCDSYTWNDQTYTTSGDKVQHFQTIHGCDSMVTLHLTVHYSDSTEFSQTVCDSYTWNDQTYTTSGDKLQHFQTIHGCDSTVTLHLTVHYSFTTEFSDTICDIYTWNEFKYDVSGDYVQHFQTIHGCDSTVTLHLTVYYSDSTEFSETVCDSMNWNGQIYTQSGDYVQVLQTIHGCDSTVVMHLTVHPSYETRFEDMICEGRGYRLHGFNVLPEQTIGRETLTAYQHLESIYGCDSTVILTLTIIDTSLEIIASPPDFCDDLYTELSVESLFPDYIWNTGETTSSITVTMPGTYIVTASYGNCQATVGVTIQPCDLFINLPNAITPSNADGLNDYFYLNEYYQRLITNFSIIIVNRWGEIVFMSNDKNFRWYGEYKGKVYLNVVYNYVITYWDLFGEEFMIKGQIVVL